MKKLTFLAFWLTSIGAFAQEWQTNGTTISNTNSGNVGIGTASPQGLLSLYNANEAGDPELLIYNQSTPSTGTGTLGSIWFGSSEGNGHRAAGIRAFFEKDFNQSDFPASLQFYTTADNSGTPAERMRITGDGNVRIGAGSFPNARLAVLAGNNATSYLNGVSVFDFSGSAIRGSITATQSDNGRLLLYDHNTALKVSITPGEDSFINTSNYFGFGTSSPLSNLHVSSGAYDSLIWPVWINNSYNGSNVSGYGVGIKLKHSNNGELNKWSGIASIQETHWANYCGLALYANEQEMVRIKYNGNVGIGITSPGKKLDVAGSARLISSSYIDFAIERSDNNSKITMGLTSGTTEGFLSSAGQLKFLTGGSAVPKVFVNEAGQVGIGTTSPDSELSVKGTIHTQEVKVDLNGSVAPDFVFEEDYSLPELAETAAYIKTNKHLPGIPSAAEMEENGLDLKEMNLKLLQKVEELTLHLIEQQKNIVELRHEVEELKAVKK